jgi:thiamine-phosphate pyrophosphorylase
MSSKFLRALNGRRVYPITDRHLSRLSHAEQIGKLSEGGATVVQLREKIDSPAEFYNAAAAALKVARAASIALIVNDRVDIAAALNADGVHLGQDDLPPEAARRVLGMRAIIGFSTHNLQQAQLAAQMPVDYVALGPIFSTATKKSSNPAVGLENLSLVRKALGPIPLVAIGGITGKNMGQVLSAGADAVSIISDIWAPTDQVDHSIRQLFAHS